MITEQDFLTLFNKSQKSSFIETSLHRRLIAFLMVLFAALFIGMAVWGSVTSLGAVIGLIDGIYALMAFPTMISAFILAPKVMKAAKVYFGKDDLD